MIDDFEFTALLAGARVGDDAAIESLFRALNPRLMRFLRASEPRAADDVAGEVWMAVARGLAQFEGDAAGFRSWVFSIARRRIADHRRRGARRNTVPVDTATLEGVNADDDPEGETIEQLSGQEAAELIMATLSADQAEVILLRVLADLDVDDVAGIMGRSANWVRVTQHRGLRRLADRLGSKIDVIL